MALVSPKNQKGIPIEIVKNKEFWASGIHPYNPSAQNPKQKNKFMIIK